MMAGSAEIRRSPRHFTVERLCPPGLMRLGVIVLLLASWEAFARVFPSPLFFSPPSAVARGLVDILSNQGVRGALLLTLWQLAVGFVLSTVIGLAIGLPVGLHRFSYRSLFPMILLGYAIPQATILPLFVLMFGTGSASKIAYGFTHGVFPIIISVVGALHHVKPSLVTCAKTMGATKLQILQLVILPSIIPSLFTGMRLAMAATLLGTLLAELYVTSAGIGYYSHTFTETFRPDLLFALIVVLATMAIVLNEIMRRAEIRHNEWRT